MTLQLKKVDYSQLNARQQENYNFLKLSSILADYGFVTMRLTSDWQGADFIAQHVDGHTFLKVQLKGRLTFGKKYMGKDLYIAFVSGGEWYLLPHDVVLQRILEAGRLSGTRSWDENGGYSFPSLPKELKSLLSEFRLTVS